VLLGRQLVSLLTKKHIHDTYSLVIGIYAMAFMVHISKWLFENVVMQDKELAKIRIEQQIQKTPSVAKLTVKALYFGVTFGVIVPFTIGLLVDISVIQPVCILLKDSTGVYPALVSSHTVWNFFSIVSQLLRPLCSFCLLLLFLGLGNRTDLHEDYDGHSGEIPRQPIRRHHEPCLPGL